MSEHKIHIYKWFWEWDGEAAEQWLCQQAADGWYLTGFSFLCRYTFVRCEPSQQVYRFDNLSLWKQDPCYEQLFVDGGWEKVFRWAGWYCWRKRADDGRPNDIYTDAPSKMRRQRKILTVNGFLSLYLLFLLLLKYDELLTTREHVSLGLILVLLLPTLCLTWRAFQRMRRLRLQAL